MANEAPNEKPNSANADGVFEPFAIQSVPWETFSRGERFDMRFQHLSSFGGGTQISVSMEVLPPGRQASASQAHFHMLEEEHVLVLEGSLTLRLGESSYDMPAGRYVCFPAGQRAGHALISRTDHSCRYLVFGNPQPHDVAVFPDTGRVGVKLMGEGYRQAQSMAYCDGVDGDTPA